MLILPNPSVINTSLVAVTSNLSSINLAESSTSTAVDLEYLTNHLYTWIKKVDQERKHIQEQLEAEEKSGISNILVFDYLNTKYNALDDSFRSLEALLMLIEDMQSKQYCIIGKLAQHVVYQAEQTLHYIQQ